MPSPQFEDSQNFILLLILGFIDLPIFLCHLVVNDLVWIDLDSLLVGVGQAVEPSRDCGAPFILELFTCVFVET